MREGQLIDMTFLVGEWMPILEMSAKLREEQSPVENGASRRMADVRGVFFEPAARPDRPPATSEA